MLWLFVGSIKLAPDPNSGGCFQIRMQENSVNLKVNGLSPDRWYF